MLSSPRNYHWINRTLLILKIMHQKLQMRLLQSLLILPSVTINRTKSIASYIKKTKRSTEPKKSKKVDANDLSQKSTAEKVGETYGKPNASPSNYEQKLRSIFSEMSECSYVALKNIENHSEVLT